MTRNDIETSRKPKSEGGNGIAEDFYNWVEKQVAPYVLDSATRSSRFPAE
jgi:hypothetical protein